MGEQMFVMNYFKTCKEVILRPSDFFRKMPTIGGYREPLIFAAISLIISLLLDAIVSYGMFTFGIHSSILTDGMLGPMYDFSTSSYIFYEIGLFFLSIPGIFIAALILNCLYKRLGGTGSYEGTVRFISYGCAINVLSWIPLINLITIIYALYISILGGSTVHNVSMGRSAIILVLLYPITIIMFFIIAGFVVGLSTYLIFS